MTTARFRPPVDAVFYDESTESEDAIREMLPEGVTVTRFVSALDFSVPLLPKGRAGGRPRELKPNHWIVRLDDDALYVVALRSFNRSWRGRMPRAWQADHKKVGRAYVSYLIRNMGTAPAQKQPPAGESSAP